MRLYFTIAIIALLLYLTLWRPLVNRTPFPAISSALTLVLLLVVGGFEARWLYFEHQASQAVAEVSGNKKGTLHCQRLSEAFLDGDVVHSGHVMYDAPDVAVVKYQECQTLFNWMQGNKKDFTADDIRALHVLTHETIHVGGNYDEASTECVAVNNDSKMAQILGASQQIGDGIAKVYFKTMWPYMPDNYKQPGCTLNATVPLP